MYRQITKIEMVIQRLPFQFLLCTDKLQKLKW